MDKVSTINQDTQEKNNFSLDKTLFGKKAKIDFDAPDLSSAGGLILFQVQDTSFLDKIAAAIPEWRYKPLIQHPIQELVRQRVGQIMCGHEDANDCDAMRHDSALKMLAGRRPSGNDLGSQPTMTRLENHISAETLMMIAYIFVDNFVDSYSQAPDHIIIDVDDTNANTFGNQQLTLFNDYYGEYCYMPLLIYEGHSGKLILPILRAGRRNKATNISGLLKRLFEYLHKKWPRCVIELRGDSHFCCHEFMDWCIDQKGRWARYTTGLSGNVKLLNDPRVLRWKDRDEYEYATTGKPVRRCYSIFYKAASWKNAQRVIVKIEVSSLGTNIRFVVTSSMTRSADSVYSHYAGRGEMELWIKGLKELRGDRMSCNSFKANQFRLFLYGAAYIMLYNLKHTAFKGTAVETFTMDSLIKRVMLSAVLIKEQKCAVRICFASHHRYRTQISKLLMSAAA